MVFVPSTLEPRLKKYQTSSAVWRDGLTGGGARRTVESGPGDASDDLGVGTMSAGDCDEGGTAWPSGTSSLSSLDASEILLRLNDSPLAAGLCAICACLVLLRVIVGGRGSYYGERQGAEYRDQYIHTHIYRLTLLKQVTSGVSLF